MNSNSGTYRGKRCCIQSCILVLEHPCRWGASRSSRMCLLHLPRLLLPIRKCSPPVTPLSCVTLCPSTPLHRHSISFPLRSDASDVECTMRTILSLATSTLEPIAICTNQQLELADTLLGPAANRTARMLQGARRPRYILNVKPPVPVCDSFSLEHGRRK